MTIHRFRSVLYRTAKFLGDVQAIRMAFRKRSFRPIWKRIVRRWIGKHMSRAIPK